MSVDHPDGCSHKRHDYRQFLRRLQSGYRYARKTTSSKKGSNQSLPIHTRDWIDCLTCTLIESGNRQTDKFRWLKHVFVDYLIPQANAALHGILSFTASSLWMYQTAGGASSFRSFDGTSAYNSNSVPINTPTRSALSYGNSVRSSFVNGGNPTTATYDGSWSASNLFIGSNSNGSSQLNGYMLNIIYYQKRLANSVIEANSAREYSND